MTAKEILEPTIQELSDELNLRTACREGKIELMEVAKEKLERGGAGYNASHRAKLPKCSLFKRN